MAETEQILTTEVGPRAAKEPPARQPRKLVEIITSQFAALRAYHRAVLETEAVEAIHKMRVTTRRLQASLDLLEREMKVRKLKRRLRTWRRRLSTVRNYDVFLELIEKETPRRGRARREQLELVKGILKERRLHRAAKVRQFLEDIDIDALAVKLGFLEPSIREATDIALINDDAHNQVPALEATAETMDLDERSVAGYAAERLEQRLEEFQALAAQSHPTNNPAELHQLRIAAKRVRYLLEIVTEMGYGDASRALAWLRTLQDRIGDWHDLEALEEEIIAIVSSDEFMKQHLAESGRMLQAAAHLQKKKEALVSRLFPVRPPQYLEVTSQRIARALRRNHTRARESVPSNLSRART
ncbi:MAG TPA: CHAD domain-containing protein [Blastocatellia bacterium]|nr:CHAD domain-containing protein [Blastocatellia bacterium]